ncbi:GNAT family N-acetyltransferase [Microbacterium rhizomatis]|uniref:GNAT family N-acetyltransferase n=1 Tax=Microbacterium rhizomatis TaxID=1631477 RepID=A0A5J5J4H4_9MICO|nr:GNAT family N-acetyltransferase [Microbacterium rhizomatis]KAA9110961.1 GNAT family N-acetyltransferase [Microbacterium rhizomatis]
MPDITIAPATADRSDDAEHALTGGGDGASCRCQWWTITNAEFQAASVDDKAEMLRSEMRADPPPGLIAYVDGEAAGWIRVGPRDAQRRIARTREFADATQPWDDPSIWAVSCFVVRKEYRGIGLNARLLAAAVDFARAHGAATVEGYPIDTSVGKKSPNNLFRGVLSVFADAGFREVARPKPDRAIVALQL